MPFKLQKSFASGEISPLTYLRNDKPELHGSSVKHMINMLPISQGTARSRLGFDYNIIVNEAYCRLFEFDVSFAESYLIVVGENNIHVIDRNGRRTLGNLVLNPEFLLGNQSWAFDNATFTPGIVTLEPGGGNQDAYVRQNITTSDGSAEHRIKIDSLNPGGDTLAEIRIGTSAGGAQILSQFYTGLKASYLFTPGVTQFWVEVIVGASTADKNIDSILVEPVTITAFASDSIEFPSTYVENDIRELQVDRVPGGNSIYLFTRGHKPMVLDLGAGNIWTFSDMSFDFGAGSSPWGTEFPGAITFHEGRMFIGGTYSLPTTIWGSKPLDYTNFDIGDIANQVEDDALILPLDKYGSIQWLRSNRKMFAGMDTGEHVIFGTAGPISTQNAQTEQHSSYGSKRIHALVIEEQVTYVDSVGRKIRALRFSERTNSWTSYDITFNSEHISEGVFSEMKYGRNPLSNIVFIDGRGDMVICVYEQDQGTVGWSHFETQGKFISTAVLTEFGIDVTWVAVLRNSQMIIERSSINNRHYMDSAVVVEFVNTTNTFPGFDHLAGLTVQVVADGAMLPDMVVPGDGILIIPGTALKVSAGLGFTAALETLPEQAETQDGNTLKFAKRYNEIYVALIESARPIINGVNSYFRNPNTAMNTPEAVKTEIVEMKNLGWDIESSIIVEQPLPLPLEIAAIGGKIKESKV